MSGLTKIDDQGKAIENSPDTKPAKRKQAKEEATGLIQQTFKSGYDSQMSQSMADAYAAGVVLGIQERIAPLVTNAIAKAGFGASEEVQGHWTDAIASLPTSTEDCEWWQAV